MRFSDGHPVRVEFTKWGDRPHWAYDAVYLGADERGDWVGVPQGNRFSRPGQEFHGDHTTLRLVHGDGCAALTSFYRGAANHVETYVDIATPPRWDDTNLRMVDLDLDVVRLEDGTVRLDDEDEFEEHRVALGYPPEVVATARSTAARVLAEVRAGLPPYDGSAERWFDVLDALTGRPIDRSARRQRWGRTSPPVVEVRAKRASKPPMVEVRAKRASKPPRPGTTAPRPGTVTDWAHGALRGRPPGHR